jgi:hypothetical protein
LEYLLTAGFLQVQDIQCNSRILEPS